MFLIEENLFKTSIKYNYHDTLFNNIILILKYSKKYENSKDCRTYY